MCKDTTQLITQVARGRRAVHGMTQRLYIVASKYCAPIDQEAGWPLVNMAPHTWFPDVWSPNPDPHKRGTITKTFDMYSLHVHEKQEYLNLKMPCHTVFKRDDNVKQDVAQNAKLEKAVCAF